MPKTILRTVASISDLQRLLAVSPLVPVPEIALALRVCRERVYDLVDAGHVAMKVLPAGSRLVDVQSALKYAELRHRRTLPGKQKHPVEA